MGILNALLPSNVITRRSAMKKRVLSFVVVALLLLTGVPMAAFAAVDNSPANAGLGAAQTPEQQLDAINTATDIAQYDTALPTGGVVWTVGQINAEMKKFNSSISISQSRYAGKATSVKHICELDFTSMNGQYSSAYREKVWDKAVVKNTFPYPAEYSEMTKLITNNAAVTPIKTVCRLISQDKSYNYEHRWYKKAKTGEFKRAKKTSSKPPSTKPPTGPTYPPGYEPKITTTYMKYDDETVLGQKCFVYGIVMKVEIAGMVTSTTTMYNYVSRSSGIQIKLVTDTGAAGYSVQTTQLLFEKKFTSKPDSLFKPPVKTVKFKLVSNFSIPYY